MLMCAGSVAQDLANLSQMARLIIFVWDQWRFQRFRNFMALNNKAPIIILNLGPRRMGMSYMDLRLATKTNENVLKQSRRIEKC